MIILCFRLWKIYSILCNYLEYFILLVVMIDVKLKSSLSLNIVFICCLELLGRIIYFDGFGRFEDEDWMFVESCFGY